MLNKERLIRGGLVVELSYNRISSTYYIHCVKDLSLTASGTTRKEALEGFDRRIAREHGEIRRAITSPHRIRDPKERQGPS